MTDLFFEMDKTRAGYVHLPALLDFLKRCMPTPPPPGQLRRLYALLDVDGDGTVAYKELSMRLNRAKAALRVAEAEGTGCVRPHTYSAWLHPARNTLAVLAPLQYAGYPLITACTAAEACSLPGESCIFSLASPWAPTVRAKGCDPNLQT